VFIFMCGQYRCFSADLHERSFVRFAQSRRARTRWRLYNKFGNLTKRPRTSRAYEQIRDRHPRFRNITVSGVPASLRKMSDS
jgi:hypothetical protein